MAYFQHSRHGDNEDMALSAGPEATTSPCWQAGHGASGAGRRAVLSRFRSTRRCASGTCRGETAENLVSPPASPSCLVDMPRLPRAVLDPGADKLGVTGSGGGPPGDERPRQDPLATALARAEAVRDAYPDGSVNDRSGPSISSTSSRPGPETTSSLECPLSRLGRALLDCRCDCRCKLRDTGGRPRLDPADLR